MNIKLIVLKVLNKSYITIIYKRDLSIMTCDYFIETSIIIEYYSVKGERCKIVTNTKRKKGFVDKHYKNNKYVKKLTKQMEKKCFTKTIYDNKKWTKENYQEKYESKLRRWFPKIDTFIKIYKDSVSWPVKNIAY
jgi:hypothetical protein